MALYPVYMGSFTGLAGDDAGSDPLDTGELVGFDGPQTVYRKTESIDNPADNLVADRDLGDPARPLDDVPFLDEFVLT